MARYEKGSESQASIMQAAKQLFYQNGYQATTVRDIAKVSGLNFGLLRYYFGAKSDIGLLAYKDFRSSLNHWLRLQIVKKEQQYFFSEAAELKFCMRSPEFARFLVELATEQVTKEYFEAEALEVIRQNSPAGENEDRIIFNSTVAVALKMATVRLLQAGKYSDDRIIMESYLNELLGCCEMADKEVLIREILLFCKKYTFNMVGGLIPVIVQN